jgi:hypothetical protein
LRSCWAPGPRGHWIIPSPCPHVAPHPQPREEKRLGQQVPRPSGRQDTSIALLSPAITHRFLTGNCRLDLVTMDDWDPSNWKANLPPWYNPIVVGQQTLAGIGSRAKGCCEA